MTWGLRVVVGVAMCGIIAVSAHPLKALTASGAWAAALIGTTLFVGGGWTWLALVGTFFITSSILTHCDPWADGSRV